MNICNSLLADFEQKLGKGVTTGDQLDKVGRAVFGSEWGGVFARDGEWRRRKGYKIVNLDRKNQSGSHWVGVVGDMVYDSFGRTGILGPELRDTENDAKKARRQLWTTLFSLVRDLQTLWTSNCLDNLKKLLY
jgi:hypothetical protein